jgi:hypothetical protein
MITSWSPSRLSNWEECARRAKFQIVEKLCTACFIGKVEGPWGMPQVCNQCRKVEQTPAAIARGTSLHTLCEQYIINGGALHEDLVNVTKFLKRFRTLYKQGKLLIESDMVFNLGWEPAGKFQKGAWLRTKLDVLIINGKKAKVVDWKSGGLDKKTGEIRPNDKYPDQLQIYCTAVLTTYPEIEEVESSLIFIDAPEGKNEVVQGGRMTRAQLPSFQKKWSQRAAGMLGDTIFAAKPSFMCRFCAYSKTRSGPCSF